MAYGDFKDLTKRTASNKVLRDKTFNIAKNPKYDEYQRGLTSMVYKFFDKKTALLADTSASSSGIKNEIQQNQQLVDELNQPIIKKFQKRDNIWGVDLADMQLISKFNKSIRFLLCVIEFFSKYAWVIPLKDKKGVTITNAFQNVLDKSDHKPNKVWVDKGSEFYNSSFKKWLKDNDTEMYST